MRQTKREAQRTNGRVDGLLDRRDALAWIAEELIRAGRSHDGPLNAHWLAGEPLAVHRVDRRLRIVPVGERDEAVAPRLAFAVRGDVGIAGPSAGLTK